DHAAVARGVFHMRAHEDAGGTAFGLLRDQAAQRGGAQQGRIAVKHHQVAIQVRQGIAADHKRVARAFLFGLLDEADAGAGHGLAHLFGLVSDHGEDALRRRKFESRVDDVPQKGLSAGAVQHLGLTALHAGAESGGQDHDGYGLFHYYYYAFLRRRPSCASFMTMAAVASGSWRILSMLLERLPVRTLSPIFMRVSISFSTGRAACLA